MKFSSFNGFWLRVCERALGAESGSNSMNVSLKIFSAALLAFVLSAPVFAQGMGGKVGGGDEEEVSQEDVDAAEAEAEAAEAEAELAEAEAELAEAEAELAEAEAEQAEAEAEEAEAEYETEDRR
jgi:hypothetical protein